MSPAADSNLVVRLECYFQLAGDYRQNVAVDRTIDADVRPTARVKRAGVLAEVFQVPITMKEGFADVTVRISGKGKQNEFVTAWKKKCQIMRLMNHVAFYCQCLAICRFGERATGMRRW